MLKTEDPGIDRVVIRSIEGVRIASTTSIQTLMQSDFDLVINDVTYRVATPPFEGSSGALSVLGEDDMMKMGDVRALVGQLYEVKNGQVLLAYLHMYLTYIHVLSTCKYHYHLQFQALHVEEYQAQQEQKLIRELESMRDELAPLEESKRILETQAENRTQHMTWLGLGAMSVQFGILARLTWWEYSWDIMEPGKKRSTISQDKESLSDN